MSEIAVRALYEEGIRVGGAEVLADISEARVVWVDVTDPDEASMEVAAREFGLHELAVEDTLHFPQRPKLESYGTSLFLIWIVPEFIDGDGLDLRELDIFLGERWIVTVHRDKLDAVDRVADEAEAYLERGADWTVHALLDLTVDKVFPVLDEIGTGSRP